MNKTLEINQAINAGNNVVNKANNVLNYLGDARLWGLFDMFSNRSLLSGVIKHSKIKDAEYAMNELKYAIDRFNDELDDVKIYDNINNVDIDDFIKFLDIFCDNFFVDLYAMSKISNAREQVESLINEVNNIINNLTKIN